MIHWQLGNHTDPALQSVLQPTLDEANELMLQVLEIPPEIFQFGTLQVDVDVSEVSEMDVARHGTRRRSNSKPFNEGRTPTFKRLERPNCQNQACCVTGVCSSGVVIARRMA